ncbi:MAG: hypothetical protein AAF471_00840 [Myxococcota bacterium]
MGFPTLTFLRKQESILERSANFSSQKQPAEPFLEGPESLSPLPPSRGRNPLSDIRQSVKSCDLR